MSENEGTVTLTGYAYTCPACRRSINGHFKYKWKPALLDGSEPPGTATLNGQLHIFASVMDAHNCLPPTTRGAGL